MEFYHKKISIINSISNIYDKKINCVKLQPEVGLSIYKYFLFVLQPRVSIISYGTCNAMTRERVLYRVIVI